jgi:glucokinase
MADRIECYDVGGTQIRGAIISNEAMLSGPITVKTPRGGIDQVVSIVGALSRQLNEGRPSRDKATKIIVGLPGPVSGSSLCSSPPLGLTESIDMVSALSPVFNLPVMIQNDLNLAIRGELHRGFGRLHRSFCLLSLSTGIGTAVVLDGKILNRRIELGHTILAPHSDSLFTCGLHHGCWVSVAAGIGLENLFKKQGITTTPEAFFEDNRYHHLVSRIREFNAQGIGNLINAYDPDAVVIMGSIGIHQFDKVIPDKTQLERFTIMRPIPPVMKTCLGDLIGLWGAYYYGLE